ncbi:MAG TPA: hypothetical protein VL977_03310, partial [Solirubrobacteraceae bacterium]|nr:hypothetical protein [Solirubrobacteraceae bacterium]
MSERLAFTLSAPAAGVHAAGRDGERCVALLRGETRTTAAVELRDAGGHFETALEGVGAVALEPLGEAIEPADGSRGWICRLVASGLEGFGSVRREPV